MKICTIFTYTLYTKFNEKTNQEHANKYCILMTGIHAELSEAEWVYASNFMEIHQKSKIG